MPDTLFTSDVVAAVARHMNSDHPEDNALICRALGGQPGVTTASVTTLDAAGITFSATTGEGIRDVLVPWQTTPTERPHIRAEVVRMYREACAALGVEPRQEEASGRPAH